MTRIVFLLLLLPLCCWPQKPVENLLDAATAAKVITPAVQKNLKITFPIFRTYSYRDTSGLYYLALTEREYQKTNDGVLNDSIRAFLITEKSGVLQTEATVFDHIKPKEDEVSDEFSITFWTKYLTLKDLDGDGLTEPIIVWGTIGEDAGPYGQIKILVLYKGRKIMIRHHESPLDSERNTQVDAAFYTLPIKIRHEIASIMGRIEKDKNGLFPSEWKTAMVAKKLRF